MSDRERSTRLARWLEERYTLRVALPVFACLIAARVGIEQVDWILRDWASWTCFTAFVIAWVLYVNSALNRRSRAKGEDLRR